MDRPSKIVGRRRVGTINGFRGVPGGWVLVREKFEGRVVRKFLSRASPQLPSKAAQRSRIGPCLNFVSEMNQLSGGRDRDRTCDPFHVKEVLSR